MAAPDLTIYHQLPNGHFNKIADRSGPYVWDGTIMRLVDEAIKIVEASFARPADTTAYASGDLIANSTVAGSVVPMSFTVADQDGGSFSIPRARFRKSGVATSGWAVRLHLYRVLAITCANGDNGAFSTNKSDDYLGYFDFGVPQAFTDGAAANGVPAVGYAINGKCAADSKLIYGLAEARGAGTPVSAETIKFLLEAYCS